MPGLHGELARRPSSSVGPSASSGCGRRGRASHSARVGAKGSGGTGLLEKAHGLISYVRFAELYADLSRDQFHSQVWDAYLLLPWLDRDRALAAVGGRATDYELTKLHLLRLPTCPFGGAKELLALGRSWENDLMVPHPVVSKIHAAVYRENDHWWLMDEDSCNGTSVMGEDLLPHGPVQLTSRALILLGGRVVLEYLEPADLFARLARDGYVSDFPC